MSNEELTTIEADKPPSGVQEKKEKVDEEAEEAT